MRLDRSWIEAHIPHQGRMCLLDEVVSYDATRVRCRSATHRTLDHPLRAHGRLGATCGIEYAAQAIAVHGALLSSSMLERSETPAGGVPGGYLASIRATALFAARLDDIATDLIADAELIHGDASGRLYEFRVSSESRLLLTGRVTIAMGRR